MMPAENPQPAPPSNIGRVALPEVIEIAVRPRTASDAAAAVSAFELTPPVEVPSRLVQFQAKVQFGTTSTVQSSYNTERFKVMN